MTERLADKYRLRGRFHRSTRLDADLRDDKALDSYVLHASGWDVLRRIFDQVAAGRQRAFTWTGPYGGGKSSLALLLAALLSPNPTLRGKAQMVLGAARGRQAAKLLPPGRKGWVVVPAVGRRAAPEALIAEALDRAVSSRWPRRKPARLARPLDGTDGKAVIARLVEAGEEAAKDGGGLLLVIDEMGKLLEHAAEASGDLYFFQDLAEAFSRAKAPCVFIGVLHQAFQEYAGRLGQSARDEWAKVQGRFLDIPFSVSLEEVVGLVGKAIDGPPAPKGAQGLCRQVADAVDLGALSKGSGLAADLAACWPLHPVTVLLLGPLSRTRFGQNERSTFGFLCSGEPAGFREFLLSQGASHRSGYTPDRLWDYLQLNLEPAILASPESHRWSEAAEAVERTRRKGGDLHVGLAKAIALLDLFGKPFGLKATKALLAACAAPQPAAKVDKALRDLQAWSIALYRRHLGAWGLYAGSDIDLDAAVAAARAQLGGNAAQILAHLPAQPPIVAKRHYHRTGTLRWFDARIVASSALHDLDEALAPRTNAAGAFVLVLPEDGGDERSLERACRQASDWAALQGRAVAFGAPVEAGPLRALALEVVALERVRATLPALEGDAVARREMNGRLSAARAELDRAVRRAFNAAVWLVRGEARPLAEVGGLHRLASDLADAVYPDAPVIRNELVNRDRPSTNAVAARRALMHRMVLGADRENLGIEGYPAELGIYLSVLKASGLHQQDSKYLMMRRFGAPRGTELSKSYAALWRDAETFLERAEADRLPISELYERWRRPPFGLRQGVLPILALALILAKEDELALYMDGLFTPAVDDLLVDRLLQNPSDVALRRFRMKGVRRDALQRIAEVVAESLDHERQTTALAIAKPLALFAHRLHPWVKRTKRLSAETTAIRDALLQANDPYGLLFVDLPKACGISATIGGKATRKTVDVLIGKLQGAVSELRSAHERMLEDLAATLADGLRLPDASADGFAAAGGRAAAIIGASGDFRLDAFARRLQSADGGKGWVEGLASLAANKPSRDWTDADLDRARIELMDLADRFLRVERLVATKGLGPGAFSLSGVVSDGGEASEVDVVIRLDRDRRAAVFTAARALRQTLDAAGLDRDLRIAAAARLLRELTQEEGSAEKTGKRAPLRKSA